MSTNEQATRRTTLQETSFKEVMTEVSGSERNGLDTGKVAERTSNAPMDMVMEMATAVTFIAAKTAGKVTLEPMERNENGNRRTRSQVLVTAWAAEDWKSSMERVAQQEAHELAQLHQKIAKIGNKLETLNAQQEVQWRGMKVWLEEKEKKWDAYHQNNLLWGEGIMGMVARAVAATDRVETENRKADRKGVGLKPSIHTNLIQTGGPQMLEERQPLQHGRQLKSMPMTKPKRNPSPKPNPPPAPTLRPVPTPTPTATSTPTGATPSAPTPTTQLETVPPRNQQKPASPAPSLRSGSIMADRCLMLKRDESVPLPNEMGQAIASAITRALFLQQAPAHIRNMKPRRNRKGASTAITHQNATAEMAMQYCDIINTAGRTVHRGVMDVEENLRWERRKIHAVTLGPSCGIWERLTIHALPLVWYRRKPRSPPEDARGI